MLKLRLRIFLQDLPHEFGMGESLGAEVEIQKIASAISGGFELAADLVLFVEKGDGETALLRQEQRQIDA